MNRKTIQLTAAIALYVAAIVCFGMGLYCDEHLWAGNGMTLLCCAALLHRLSMTTGEERGKSWYRFSRMAIMCFMAGAVICIFGGDEWYTSLTIALIYLAGTVNIIRSIEARKKEKQQ